jgi:hypothetical protein
LTVGEVRDRYGAAWARQRNTSAGDPERLPSMIQLQVETIDLPGAWQIKVVFVVASAT